MRSVRFLVAAAAVALIAAMPSWADTPGHHPAYLHALSDLRDARAHLEHLTTEPVVPEEAHAIDHIDKAIGEIKQAAIMDGKNIQDHMPVDTHLGRHDRFMKALELLDKAQHDVSGEEDQPDTDGSAAAGHSAHRGSPPFGEARPRDRSQLTFGCDLDSRCARTAHREHALISRRHPACLGASSHTPAQPRFPPGTGAQAVRGDSL